MKPKNGIFKKINIIDKPLTGLIKKIRERAEIK